jgi:DNA-binding PadR family transcriptional regulator
VDVELFRELHEVFRYRGDALILATLAARPPLRYTALARAIIEVTGDRLADGEINRCLPRLEAAGLVVADGPERRKKYRLTSLGREKAATLNLIAETLRRRRAGSSRDELVRLGGHLQAGTSPDGILGGQPARHGAATPSPSAEPHGQTPVDDARRRPALPNSENEDVSAVPEVDKQAIDTSVPHPARRYNYLLGGKDNFAADRESADAIEAQLPGLRIAARENRHFLKRAVEFLVTDAGIRQFLDIGTGLPTADNTHEVAQAIAPESRIV